MTRPHGVNVFVLLTLLLVAGQAGAALHALQHHAGYPQGEVCSTCVTVAQLGAASVDNPIAIESIHLRDTLEDSFGLEQDMLPVEIEELEAEVNRLKQELKERAENREEIIDEAVEEILSGEEEEDDEEE